MLREIELGVHLEMAIEANRRILPGIDDGLSPPGRLKVLARGSMARLASGKASPLYVIFVKAGVRAAWKKPRDVAVAIRARFVADKRGTLNFWRRHDGAVHG